MIAKISFHCIFKLKADKNHRGKIGEKVRGLILSFGKVEDPSNWR